MGVNDTLINAVREGRVDDVRRALTSGVSPNVSDASGRPALLFAVEQDDTASAETLLSYGADPDARWQPPATEPDPSVLKMFEDQPAASREAYLRSCSEPDAENVYWECRSADMARLLVGAGLNPAGFDIYLEEECFFPAAVGADQISPQSVEKQGFQSHANPRAGRANPEPHLPAFWSEQIRTCQSAYAAENAVMGETGTTGGPVWSFARFGRSATRLPDGGWLLIAGEHEDHYDPDFAIYADATVISSGGRIQHFIYPDDVFPPTDFHTASLIGDTVWLIGSLGYPDRRGERCQVLSLDIGTFTVTRHETKGDDPGWVHGHEATTDGRCISISGGKLEPDYRDRLETHVLDTRTLIWSSA